MAPDSLPVRESGEPVPGSGDPARGVGQPGGGDGAPARGERDMAGAALTQPGPDEATAGRTAWGRHLQTPLRQFLRT